MQSEPLTLYRARIAHFPKVMTLGEDDPENAITVYNDGGLLVEGEKISDIGLFSTLQEQCPHAQIVDYRGKIIIPGLIDSHLHFPQTEMIASYGEQLLSWLENYTFPTELKFSSRNYCDHIASLFLNQLIMQGTTTALAFATVHAHSADALFRAATARNMAMITGKVCMDRNCPESLQDNASLAQQESAELIGRWHGKGRNLYAITPRFAPTSSPAQMAALGELAQDNPDVFIQTHLSENKDEINWVKSLYPDDETYLDVYARFHMVRKRAVFGHCVHLPDESWEHLADAGATAAFCPTSNLFLGSGLFQNAKAFEHKVSVVLATDVGAGTSFNLFRTFGDAYKISQLNGNPIDAISGLYMMTQGPAAAYDLTEQIGNLNPGTIADFLVLDPHFDELSQLRIQPDAPLADVLFALSFLGDERAIEETYIAGKPAKSNTIKELSDAVA